jgi:uncharacterized protein YijF (DUF1287 family)
VKRPGRFLFPLLCVSAVPQPSPKLSAFLEAAQGQVGVTVHYDGSYRWLPFPGGDVPLDRGVCTDVVIRAYRAIGVDLQLLVNRDMTASFSAYPQLWGQSRPDPNIDHRRVANLATFFTRHGGRLPISRQPEGYLPGDLVTWRLPSGFAHVGIVSGQRENGRPLIVHNIGAGARLEDVLFAYSITGHFRFFPDDSAGSLSR